MPVGPTWKAEARAQRPRDAAVTRVFRHAVGGLRRKREGGGPDLSHTRICNERQIGVTHLYNLVDEGAFVPLSALHKALDVAVASCYGWPPAVARGHDELVRRLLDLNREISQGERDYDPV